MTFFRGGGGGGGGGSMTSLSQTDWHLKISLTLFSNLNISPTSGPIITKFYLNHPWGGGKTALGFGPDQIGTLVSMATDSSHRVIMGKML